MRRKPTKVALLLSMLVVLALVGLYNHLAVSNLGLIEATLKRSFEASKILDVDAVYAEVLPIQFGGTVSKEELRRSMNSNERYLWQTYERVELFPSSLRFLLYIGPGGPMPSAVVRGTVFFAGGNMLYVRVKLRYAAGRWWIAYWVTEGAKFNWDMSPRQHPPGREVGLAPVWGTSR